MPPEYLASRRHDFHFHSPIVAEVGGVVLVLLANVAFAENDFAPANPFDVDGSHILSTGRLTFGRAVSEQPCPIVRVVVRRVRFRRLGRFGRSLRPPPPTRPRLFLQRHLRIVKRLRDRVSFRIDPREQLDLAFRLLQRFVALLEQLHPLFVPRERLGQPKLPVFQLVDDRFQQFERLLKRLRRVRILSGQSLIFLKSQFRGEAFRVELTAK